MIRLAPDRFAEIDLRGIGQGTRRGTQRAAEQRAGHRHADRQTRQRANAGAHRAAGHGTVPRCRAASGQQKSTGNTQNGNTIHGFAPQQRKWAQYRIGFFQNARVLYNTKGYSSTLKYQFIISEQEHRQKSQFDLKPNTPAAHNPSNREKTANRDARAATRAGGAW